MNWFERVPQTKHRLQYRNLQELRRLCAEWAVEIGNPPPPPSPTESLDELLDERSVEQFLAAMEESIRAAQYRLITEALGEGSDPRPSKDEAFRRIALSRLEQASWRAGKNVGTSHWGHWTRPSENAAPLNQRQASAPVSVKEAFLASLENPIYPCQGLSAYVVRRITPNRVEVELKACPHSRSAAKRSSQASVGAPISLSAADAEALCHLHLHWFKGFAYSLNPSLRVERERIGGTCALIWTSA